MLSRAGFVVRGGAGRDVAIALVIFALGLWQNLSDLHLTRIHPDETRWLNRAYFVRELGDPLGLAWDDSILMRDQPPLGAYLMGLALLAQGRDLETNGYWDFHQDYRWNFEHGNMAAPADLDAGRRINAVIGALTVVVVYFLGKRLLNRVAGLVGALFLTAHPLHIGLSSLATPDVLLALLVALAALAACRWVERPTWGRALLLGTLLGLGGATKLSPLFVTVPLAGLGVLLLVARRWWSGTRAASGWMLLSLPVVAFATFVAVYPYLWPSPIARTINLFDFRVQEMANQGQAWGWLRVESRAEAFRRVGITLSDTYSTSGRIIAKLAHGFGIERNPVGIDLLVAIAGLELLIALIICRGLLGPHLMTLLVLGGQSAVTVLGMRADFARYHLPILLFAAVCIGLVGGQLWEALARSTVRERARSLIYAGLDRLVPGGEALPSPVATAWESD
jgi:4-amino-4-deoxy-L-arabinose transferase-like glycosyltransferase